MRAFKHGGIEHRSWSAQVVIHDGSLIILDAIFDREIAHAHLGTISPGTESLEYYWLDRWYNVFRFAGPGGILRNFYCNINSPPSFDGKVLAYVDLDIDVVVYPDFSVKVLDLDEFERNSLRYGYSPELQDNARRALKELVESIETRAFPFDE